MLPLLPPIAATDRYQNYFCYSTNSDSLIFFNYIKIIAYLLFQNLSIYTDVQLFFHSSMMVRWCHFILYNLLLHEYHFMLSYSTKLQLLFLAHEIIWLNFPFEKLSSHVTSYIISCNLVSRHFISNIIPRYVVQHNCYL